jgi:hypothetical protein
MKNDRYMPDCHLCIKKSTKFFMVKENITFTPVSLSLKSLYRSLCSICNDFQRTIISPPTPVRFIVFYTLIRNYGTLFAVRTTIL